MTRILTSDLDPGNYLLKIDESGAYWLWKLDGDKTWHGYRVPGIEQAFKDLVREADGRREKS